MLSRIFFAFVLTFWFSASASAEEYRIEWGSATYNVWNEDIEQSCRELGLTVIPGLYYDGDFYDYYEKGPDVWTADCYDTAQNVAPVEMRCGFYEDDGAGGEEFTNLGKQLCPVPVWTCTAAGWEVGNPVDVISRAKTEEHVDWRSPLEPRFAIERFYRSGIDTYTGRNPTVSTALYAGVWRSNLNETIQTLPHLPNEHMYHTARGDRVVFEGLDPGVEKYTTAGFDLVEYFNAYNDEGHLLIDGQGVVRQFRRFQTDWALTAMEWPDGYRITISRQSGEIDVVEDNRGHRAEFTWTSLSGGGRAITKIEIDQSYQAGSFISEVEINYDYFDNAMHSWLPYLESVTRIDVSSQSSEQIYGYSYLEDPDAAASSNVFLYPPLLSAWQDGRTNSSGSVFDVSSFEYDVDPDDEYRFFEVGSQGLGAISTFRPATATENFGGVNRYEFESDLGISKVTNPLGHETTYSTAIHGTSPSVTQTNGLPTPHCLGTAQSYSFSPPAGSPEGYVYEQVERNGSVTQFTRDSDGRILTRTEDANGASPRVTTYTWHTDFRKPLTRTTSQMSETFTYDAEGLLLTYSQEDVLTGSPDFGEVRTWTYTYSTVSSGLKVLDQIDGPGDAGSNIDDITTFLYDTQGRMTRVTDPNNLRTIVQSFDASGLPSLITDQQGFEWGFEYDINGRLLSSTFEPSGVAETSTFTYDIVGQLISSTDSLGRTWDYTYDEARRLIQIESPSGDTISFDHDAMGNVTRTEYTDHASVLRFLEEAQYDELGRILTILGSNGQTMGFSHDVEDNLATSTDALSFTTTNTYDALNRMTDVVDRASFTTSMDHNDSDNVTTYTDPRSISTTFTYNGFGEVVQEVSADRGTQTYEYDSRGLVTSFTDGNGQERQYTYDDGGRLTRVKFVGAGALNQYFYYHTQSYNAGTLRRVFDQSGQTQQYAESTRGNIDRDWRTIDNVQYRIKYRTDEEGQFERITYPSGAILRLYYDNDGNLSDVGWQGVDPTTGNVISPMVQAAWDMTYLPFGPMDRMEYPDGGIYTASYDSSYRLTNLLDMVGTTALRDVSYGWTTRDNLASVTDNLFPAQNETYGYSAREFLASADGAWGEFDYTYDGVGNRTSFSEVIGGTTITDDYNYDFASNRLESLSTGGTPQRNLTYDAAGNVIMDIQGSDVYTYTYDAANRMSSISLNGVQQAEYEYNFLGQQVIRRLASGDTIHSVHDIWGNRIAEYLYDEVAGTSSLIREYIWAGDRLVGVWENGAYYAVRTDHIGRPIFATNTSGNVVWEASYLPFGGVRTSVGPNSNLRFPGQWFQLEAGLHQNWMRDYDPTLGRYLQADPLGIAPGHSLYTYSYSNPSRYIDPDGEHPLLAAMAIGAALGVAFDFSIDMIWGDGCYTLAEAGQAAALGALFSGGGFWATGVRRGGKEFSHAIPTRTLNNSALGRSLNRRSNPYRTLNGNYVSPYRHARTDPYRHLPGGTPTIPFVPRMLDRAPKWMWGFSFGALSVGECGCEQ